MNYRYPLGMFSAVGVEMEWMIVDADTLDVLSIADELIRAESGDVDADIERADLAWSNELVAHLIEIKTNGPRVGFAGLASALHEEAKYIDTLLAPMGARLLPTAMHPWMTPKTQTVLWPHEYGDVYRTFDRIFGCRSHGWANVQSVHLNLPFADDREFGRLHAAIRVLLPILPALAASSPVIEGRITPVMDNRLEAYRRHAAKIPLIGGAIIPEPIFTRVEYEALLDRLYAAIAPYDPDGLLRHEWLNARGAIARFDRGAIEIRLLDVQETPRADIAIAAAVTEAARGLATGAFASIETLQQFPTERLVTILTTTARDAEEAVIRDSGYLDLFGFGKHGPERAGDLWRRIVDRTLAGSSEASAHAEPLERIFTQGCLARRITETLNGDRRHSRLHDVYRELADCLVNDRLFDAGSC